MVIKVLFAIMSVWDWFRNFTRTAYISNDPQRIHMLQLYYESTHDRRSPDQRLSLLMQSRQLGEELREPCWILWIDHWRIEVLQWAKRDFKTALDVAVRAVMLSRKPENRICQIADRIHINLVEVYLGLDAVGYADSIRENLDYVATEMRLDYESRCMMEFRRSCLEIELDELEQADASAWRCIEACENADGSSYYLAIAYANLCITAFRRRDYDRLRDYAIVGEICAHNSGGGERIYLQNFKAWQALAARHDSETEIANALHRQALHYIRFANITPDLHFYTAVCAYHEMAEEWEPALRLRDQQLEETSVSGSPYAECMCRLERCRLLKRMGKPLENEIETARQVAEGLVDPGYYLERLDKVING